MLDFEEVTVQFLSWLFMKCASNMLYNIFKEPRGVVALKITSTDMSCRRDRELKRLNRVTLVFQNGYVYDRYFIEDMFYFERNVKLWSWLLPRDHRNAQDYLTVRQEVEALIKDRIVVGHEVWMDLFNFHVRHPQEDVHDLSMYMPFKTIIEQNHMEMARKMKINDMTAKRRIREGMRIADICQEQHLKTLAKMILKRDIQFGTHDSLKQARVSLELYLKVAKQWEMERVDGYSGCRNCFLAILEYVEDPANRRLIPSPRPSIF